MIYLPVVENRSTSLCSVFIFATHNLSTITIHFILINNTVGFILDRRSAYSNIGFDSYTTRENTVATCCVFSRRFFKKYLHSGARDYQI